MWVDFRLSCKFYKVRGLFANCHLLLPVTDLTHARIGLSDPDLSQGSARTSRSPAAAAWLSPATACRCYLHLSFFLSLASSQVCYSLLAGCGRWMWKIGKRMEKGGCCLRPCLCHGDAGSSHGFRPSSRIALGHVVASMEGRGKMECWLVASTEGGGKVVGVRSLGGGFLTSPSRWCRRRVGVGISQRVLAAVFLGFRGIHCLLFGGEEMATSPWS